MLDELKEFLNIPKTPPEIKIYTTFINSKKNSLTNSYCCDLRRINYTKRVSVMEQIAQRRKKEERAKKKEMLYNLNKYKKINLRKFLNRMQDCEQKRKYDLELKKYEKLKHEVSSLQDKPKINASSIKFCENNPREPIYKRTEEIIDEKRKIMKNLTIFYTLPKEIQNQTKIMKNRHKKKYFSAENSKNDSHDNEYTIKSVSIDNFMKNNLRNKKHKKREKMTKQKSDEFYFRQEQWYKKKKANEKYYEKYYQLQNYSFSEATFHPSINQVTLEILDLKNRANTNNDECYKYNITNSRRQFCDTYENNGKTIFDKLYDDRYKKIHMSQEDFLRSINYDENFNYNYNHSLYQKKKKNKYKNISPRYLDIFKSQEYKMLNKNRSFLSYGYMHGKIPPKKKQLKINRSFDYFGTAKYFNDAGISSRNTKKIKNKNINYNYNYYNISEEEPYKKKEEINNYLWKNSLLSLKSSPGITDDITYRLNIRQKGAWDKNVPNKIMLNRNVNTRSILSSIMIK